MSKLEVFGPSRLILTLFLFFSSVNLTVGQQCTTQTPDFYDREQFVVSDVKITSKDQVFKLVKSVSSLSAIPLQPGNRFSKEDLAASKRSLIDGLIYIEIPGSMYVPLVHTIFEKCNNSASPKQVQVTFSVSYLVRSIETSADHPVTFEQSEKKTVRATAQSSRLKSLLNFLQPQPYVGFTGSGSLVGAGITVDTKNSLFQSFSMEGAGSSSSALGSGSVQGKRTFASSALRVLAWRTGYEYSKIPAEHDVALKKGTGYAQFFATTRSFDNEDENKQLIIRYGASVEGGLRQTNAESFLIPASGDLPSSNYESIKAYVGGSWRLGRHLFKTSYGLQIAGTNDEQNIDTSVDFLKHIWDSSYKVRFFPWGNKAVSLEAQFTTGKINQRGALPVAERFFGSNIEENFIAGADWLIRSGPFIRSLPRQHLTTNSPFLGGNSFVSTNFTFAVTVWAKPVIPKEAQEQIPIAFQILETHPKGETLRRLLTTAFTTETKSYAEQIASFDYKALENELLDLQRDLASIPAGDVTPATKKLIEKCSADVKSALEVLALIKEKIVFDPGGKFVTTNLDARPEIVELVIASLPDDPDDPDAPPEAGLLRKIVQELGESVKQTDAALDTLRPRLSERQGNVQTFADSLKNRNDAFQAEGLPEARANAIRFLQHTHSQIDTIGRELNQFSIGPLFMFDAARVRVQGAGGSFRYGVGPGLQIGLFGFEFRSGYSFNPNRRPGEPRGAVVFSFDVSDILP